MKGICSTCSIEAPATPKIDPARAWRAPRNIVVVAHVRPHGEPCRDGFPDPYYATTDDEREANFEQLLADVESWA